MSVNMEKIGQRLQFLREAERLKSILRSAYSSQGRHESTAEHSWRLCLMAMVFQDEFAGLDFSRILQLCVVHDLGEAIHGDVPAVDQDKFPNKGDQERADMLTLTEALDTPLRDYIMDLWEDYETGRTQEAMAVKAMDKLETILQHTQGQNPKDFDYGFNLTYGTKYTDATPLFQAMRANIDKDTRSRMNE